MNKNITITLVVIMVIAIGAYFFPTSKTVVERVTERVGSLSGPDIQSEYLNINGIRYEYRSVSFNTASTTRCALPAPKDRSSVLVQGVVRSATTTDYVTTIAKATTAFATTTLIRTETVTANTETVYPVASTTVSSLEQTNRTFAAGEFLVVSTAGPTATSFDSGYCSAVFMVGQ